MRPISSSALSILALVASARVCEAERLPMKGRIVGREARAALHRRVQMSGPSTSAVDDQQDTSYTTNITIGGSPRTVIIDTGSSDLWTVGNVDESTATQTQVTVTYASGNAEGFVSFAPVEFAGYQISNQAYINVTGGDPPGGQGLVGLGPYTGSQVREAVGDSSGDPIVNRIFAQNTSSPNFISFTLERQDDPTQDISGELTIGEVIPGYENVTSQPHNSVQLVPTSDNGDQHWSLLVDSVIGPDGQQIPYTTTVPNEKKAVAVLDSGFSLPQVPSQISDAFYGRVQGAEWNPGSPFGPAWQIPCGQELNVSFVIGGVTYPIHPLDTSFQTPDDSGNTICIGMFQPSTVAFSNAAELFDMVLGMAFLRNTYTLINYGDFTDANATSTANPYIQLLSLTNTAQAHQDFVQARLGGKDTTGDSQYSLLPASQEQHSSTESGPDPQTDVNVGQKVKGIAKKTLHIIEIVAIVVGSLFVLGILLCIFMCCCRGGSKRGMGLRGSEVRQPDAYRPVTYPAPQSHQPQYGAYGYNA